MAQPCEEQTAKKEGYDYDQIIFTTAKLNVSDNGEMLLDKFERTKRSFRYANNIGSHLVALLLSTHYYYHHHRNDVIRYVFYNHL